MSESTPYEITDEELDIALGNRLPPEEEEEGENDDESNDATITPAHDEYDFFATTARRLETKDSSLRTLEICNPMDWDFDRWTDEYGHLDVSAWFQSIADLLCLAQTSSHVERLELSNIVIYRLGRAVRDLMSCDDRSWARLSIDECTGISPQFLQGLGSINLKSLHLTNNSLSPSCIAALEHVLISNKALLKLRLTETLIPSAIYPLAQGLRENKTLVRLDFLGSTFQDVSTDPQTTIQALSVGLKANQGICTLSVSHCGLRDFQLESLVDSVRHHPSLTWLDLSNNFCGPKTCEALVSLIAAGNNDESEDGKTLSPISHLSGLSLISCGIEDAEAIRVGTALRSNSTLKHLHLSENHISDQGIEYFAASLKHTCSLKTLWVLENDFGDAGAKSLLSAVKTNVELDQLILDRHVSCFEDIQYQILLNRGGRKFLTADAPLALWPLVLERAQTIRHYCRRAGTDDVLYHLVCGPALLDNPSLKEVGSQTSERMKEQDLIKD